MAESSFAKGRGKDTPELPERSGAFPALSGFKWKGRKPFQAGWHHEDVKFVPCKGMGLFYIFSARKGGSSFSMEVRTEIRYASVEDIHGMGRVYADTWKAAYRGIIPQDFLDGLMPAWWEDRYRQTLGKEGMPKSVVLLLDGQIIGVSSIMKTRDEDLSEAFGEIISLYVLPEYWHRGFGSHILDFVTGELKAMGFAYCVLWTLEENLRAQAAYERFGFTRDGGRKSLEFAGQPVWEIRYRMPLS